MFDQLKSLTLDKYTLQARVRPGLLVILPGLFTIAVWFPAIWTALGGLITFVISCGVIFLIAELARYQGRKIERKMIATNGGKFTTILLRHRDHTISSATKKAYHDFLTTHSKRTMPSSTAEAADPVAADDCYRGATEWLLEMTREERRFPMVKSENISYGFRRNLLGLKTPALMLIAICLAINSFLVIENWRVRDTRLGVGCCFEVALLVALALWIFVIRIDFVEDAGRTFALRLLAQCDVLETKARATSGSKKKQS